MSYFTRLLGIVGLLCTTTLVVEAQNFSKEYAEDFVPLSRCVKRVIAPRIADNLMYMICNCTTPITNCKITLKMQNDTEKHCNMDIAHVHSSWDESFEMKSMLGGNKALLRWSRTVYQIKWTIWIVLVDMDSCKPVYLKFPNDHYIREEYPDQRLGKFDFIVNYDNFQVLLDGEEKCDQADKACILHFNHKGEPVGRPVAISPRPFVKAISADLLEPKNGMFFFTHKNDLIIGHINYNGSETTLARKNLYKDNFSTKLSSNNYGYFSLCFLENQVFCMQFKNKLKIMDTEVAIEKGQSLLNVFNRRHGGILIVYRKWTNSGYFASLENEKSEKSIIKAKEIDADGQVVKSAELITFESQNTPNHLNELIIDYLETDTAHCFYFAYMKHREDEKGDYTPIIRSLETYGIIFDHSKVVYLKRCWDKVESKSDVPSPDLTASG